MKTNNIEDIWKKMDSEIKIKSTDELRQLLEKKVKITINKFMVIWAIDIFVAIGLLVFLLVTALNRPHDILYQINNYMLITFTLVLLYISLASWIKFNSSKICLPLKDWLEHKIRLLSKWLVGKYSKMYYLIIPILQIMILLSIHVFFEDKPFIEVLKNEESMYGLIFGFLIGLFVSFYLVNKIRVFQIKKLNVLKNIYTSICNLE